MVLTDKYILITGAVSYKEVEDDVITQFGAPIHIFYPSLEETLTVGDLYDTLTGIVLPDTYLITYSTGSNFGTNVNENTLLSELSECTADTYNSILKININETALVNIHFNIGVSVQSEAYTIQSDDETVSESVDNVLSTVQKSDNYSVDSYYSDANYKQKINASQLTSNFNDIYVKMVFSKKISPTPVPEEEQIISNWTYEYRESFVYNKLIKMLLDCYSKMMYQVEHYAEMQLLERQYGQYIDDLAAKFNIKRRITDDDIYMKNKINFVTDISVEQGCLSACKTAIAFYLNINPNLIGLNVKNDDPEKGEITPCAVVISLPGSVMKKILNGEYDLDELYQYFPLGLAITFVEQNLWGSGEWENDLDEVKTTWS